MKKDFREIAMELSVKLKQKEKEIASLKEQNYFIIKKLSHNLKNPIGSAVSFSELLLESLPNLEQDKLKQFLQIINKSSKYSIQIVNQLSLYSSLINSTKDNFSTEKIELTQIIKQAVSKVKEIQKEKNNNVNFINFTPTYILGDLGLLQILFYNIIENAFNYSENNSDIKIKLSFNKNYICTSIKNKNKENIQEGFNIKQVFEPFYHYNPTEEKKTGLGLSIAKAILNKHKAKINFTQKNQNTTVKTKFLKL